MTIREEYRQKMGKRGTGFLWFYLWIFCPLLGAYHIYNIVLYTIGKQAFETGGFLYSLLVSLLAVLVVATGIILDKATFWIDISLPIVFIIQHIITVIAEISVLTGLASDIPLLNIIAGAASGILIFADVIVLFIFAAFLFYFIDHKDIYGY